MTWKFKVQRVAFALAIMAAMAMASGANWFNFDWSNWSW